MVTPTPMSLLVFGGTGPTGSLFIEQALAAGHPVTAIVRNPEAIRIQHPSLRTVKGDITRPDTFASLIQGHHAIVSCLGAKDLKPTTVYSVGVTNILTAMQATNVDRLLCLSSAALDINPKLPWLLRIVSNYILQPIFRHLYADMRLMEQRLKQSTVNWTSVRPPRLLNKPLTGQYRYAINDFLDRSYQIRRADLAHFMLHHLTDKQIVQSVVEVAN